MCIRDRENALAQQHITFEEYVEALDDNSGVPKDKFRAILDRRRGAAPEQSAVSYTHLDVYKRQAEEFMQQIYEKLPGGRATLGKLDECGQRYTVDISITGPNGNTVEVRTGWIIKKASDTVSYTHLDVYKRQARAQAGRGPGDHAGHDGGRTVLKGGV